MAKKVVVKIKGHTRLPWAKVHTIEGIKKVDHQTNAIEVSANTAMQMVDGINWDLLDEKDKPLLEEAKRLVERRKLRQEEEDLNHQVEDSEDEEEEETQTEKVSAVQETEDLDQVGDETTREVIKNLPKLSLGQLKATAEEYGIEVPEGEVKKSFLIKAIMKKLKS
jgi:hypothetical protein